MLDFYGLKEKPFSLLPNPRFMFLSQPYLEPKAKLLYFLKDKSASLYLYGPIGSGKTSLMRLIAQEVDGDPQTRQHGMPLDRWRKYAQGGGFLPMPGLGQFGRKPPAQFR